MARVMLNNKKLLMKLWAKSVSTACYTINKVYVRSSMGKISYDIWRGKKPNLIHCHIFGSKCYVLNDREHLDKFDSKSDEGVFLGYSNNSRAYRVYNMRKQTVMEFANVVVDYFNDFSEFSKGEEITNFFDENIQTSSIEQIAEAKFDNVATFADTALDQNVATSDDHNCHETEIAPTSDFDDPIRKEPSSRISKESSI